MAIRILHTGDLHIGNFPGPEVNGENARFQDVCKCLDALVEGARESKPDIAVIAGDVFHQARVWSDRGLKEQQTAVRFLRELERICPVVVMRGTPNHDSEEQFRTLESTFCGDDSVHIITQPEVGTYHSYDGKKVQIACIPGFDRGYYRAKHPGMSKEEENEVFTKAVEDMIIGLKAQCDADSPTVLVSHYTITGCNMESGQTAFFSQFEPVVYPSTLAAADYNLVCFGHIHRPQQLDGCKNTFYCGAISALNFNDEGQERGYWLHDIYDCYGEVNSTFHKLPTREYLTIRLKDEDVAGINESGPEWLCKLPSLGNAEKIEGKIVRVLYDCTDEHNKAFNHAVLENWLYEAGKAFWVQEITPQKITITVDRRSMDAGSTPEENLESYLAEKGMEPERIGEIVELARPIIAEATEKATTERRTGVFVPVEIEVKNYRNYREERFSFEDIRFCTINGSNGVGKSSLFMDAMADALFEETREGELTGWICNDPDARSGAIKFTFRLGDSLYRVTRTRQKSGKATLNIAEFAEGEWVDRSKEKFKDTQQEIINIIGMDSLTLKACALIMQDQYGLFLQADKEARMNILGSILGLGIYTGMESLAADRATETNRSIRSLADRAETITAGLPDRSELAAQIKETEERQQRLETQAQDKEKEIDSDTGRLPYMSRSGGERVKAALSVILALSEIKSSKAGIALIEKHNREQIETWLEKHSVPYDCLLFGKPLGDLYIDDKGVSLENFLTEKYGKLKGNSGSEIYRAGNRVIKKGKDVAKQAEWYAKAKAIGIKTPAVYSVVLDTISMEYINGETGAERILQTGDIYGIASLAMLMSLKKTGYVFNTDALKRRAEEHLQSFGKEGLFQKLFSFLETNKDKYGAEASFCHGDLSLSNIIYSRGDIYLIDPITNDRYSSCVLPEKPHAGRLHRGRRNTEH